ncbi:hypothetical protein COX08_04380 [Candidatus Beckwithbacteria bacterium CG23_combo_of_CG06-09_8_20_14_all_34_8]|uniref:Transcription regulator TrmB N-terminal domain-containing protein n=1 Tax=Candidatus Beckwithbacteria bacterium CG23_combo_of_CG06-09_8_20_14_all_34_8 TaxID=1974497 RepID=A0A2H0B580_9BACT|nr:MAG: hypothetical protein COX08_04380 [Candidatus Beckwithbacteria bacterium CG23_combo_of_CG06-09_8_20_14_all_34_8]
MLTVFIIFVIIIITDYINLQYYNNNSHFVNMSDIINNQFQVFTTLGINPKAMTVYRSCLELGQISVQNIARHAHLPRSSTYLLLEELKNKGLVSEIKIGKKIYINPVNPDKLKTLTKNCKQELDQIESLLPYFQAIYQDQTGKPNVRFFQGFEGIKTILEETLQAHEIFVLCSGYKNKIETKLDQYLEKYMQDLVDKKIKTKELIGGSIDSQKYLDDYNSTQNQIRIIPSSSNLDHIDKLIFANKVAIISYEHLNGVVIDNKAIAEYERYLFSLLWTYNNPSQN